MPIDKRLLKRLEKGFAYLEEYDKFRGRPDKRVQLCISVPLRLRRELEVKGKPNVSRFVEHVLEKALL